MIFLGNHRFYLQATQQIRSNREKLCMETDGNNLKLSPCDAENTGQKWTWTEINY